MVEKLYTVDEVIERWRVMFRKEYSPRTLSQWRYQGKGPRYYKPSVKVVYPESELLKWEKKQLKII